MDQLGLFAEEAKPPKWTGPTHHWQVFTAHRYNGWIGWTWEGCEGTEGEAKREGRRLISECWGYRKAWKIERIDFPGA